ncbi:MAG: tetratricopeptide repeat protein [Bacteroidia bacterium]
MQNKISEVMRIIIAIFLFSIYTAVSAQQSHVHHDSLSSYKTALDLYDKEKYGHAREMFDVLAFSNTLPAEARSNSAYYKAVCAMNLYHRDAETLLMNFIDHYPENPKAGIATFQLGKLYYRDKKYKNAIEWFERVDKYYLSAQEKDEFNFKLGYSYYNRQEFDKASNSFYEVKNNTSKYGPPSSYYYAHIAYLNKNYETALQEFLKLKNSDAFGPVVPYYIVQIYFMQGKFDNVISYGSEMLETTNPQNKTDINRMIGESYYRTARYQEAIPYLEYYQSNSTVITRQDHYQIAYAYYSTNQCEKAIPGFEKVANGKQNDHLAQNAYYHLAGCFVKSSNKASARNAFQFASKMDHDEKIKEDALFNYAKLSYELSYQPVAINAFKDFIKEYPNSDKIDEAHELLAQVFLTTKNYKDALASVESIKNRNERVRTALQKIAYYRGLELYNDGDTKGAVTLFDRSMQNPHDGAILALAKYWKAETLFKTSNFDASIKAYQDFLYTPAALSMPLYNLTNYNIGYSYFKKEDYENALVWFRKFTKNKSESTKERYDDAIIRIADCYFVNNDYQMAIDNYNEAISANAKASDYANFQKGIIQGIRNDLNGKIATMQKVISQYPKSQYVDDAIYEIASAHFLAGDNAKALTNFDKLINEHSTSSYVRKALLGKALVHYNRKEDSQAISSYKQVIEKYPGSAEAKEALAGLRVIYVNAGNVDEYLSYMESVPSAGNVSVAVQDSITYQAAEVKYMAGNCIEATPAFSNYLTKFPNGFFAVNAHFYRAECELKSGNNTTATQSFEYVINNSNNTFTERSLLRLGNIYAGMNDCPKAVIYFQRLENIAEISSNLIEARAGLMRCYFADQDYNKTISAASALQQMEKVSNEIINEATLLHGKSAFELKDYVKAQKEFAKLSKITNSEIGAEAKYHNALILYLQDKYKESQAIVFELINQVPSYDYWVARGFILLGDNYLALKDTFQARHTYKSIVDNYEGEELKSIAQQKLDSLNKQENRIQQMDGKENEDPEIDLN